MVKQHYTLKYMYFLTVILFSGQNGINRGMKNLEWHISKFSFCNGIFPIRELGNGIDPINPNPNGYGIDPINPNPNGW